jgi:hypothetical protein
MPRLLHLLAGGAVAASLFVTLLPEAALSASKAKIKAFNPQPDPPGKGALKGSNRILGPNTKGSWKRFHDVEEKSKSKSSKSLPAVQKSKKPK